MSNKIIRISEIKERLGVSKSSIYLWISKGKFPKSIPLGSRSVGWLEDDFNQWLEQRIAVSQT
ncbi:AlpA family transcriptional regulator [Vibrio sp. 2-Bac 85]